MNNPSNPISLMDIAPKLDPATADTSVHVSGLSSTLTPLSSDSEMEYTSAQRLDPLLSSANSLTNTRDSIHLPARAKDLHANTSQTLYNDQSAILDDSKPLLSNSHSKLSDLASKVTDYLFSTRRSIDINFQSSHDHSKQHHDSSTSSPQVSRESSHISLSSLVRSSRQPGTSKRRSFLSRGIGSPTRDSSLIQTLGHSLKHNASSTSLSSVSVNTTVANGTRLPLSSSSAHCHFACDSEGSSSSMKVTSSQSRVKETHYVHVEYDPVTRKRVLNTYEILRDLGSGQHGKVKLAKDIATGAFVAIKIVDRSGKPSLMLNRLSRGKGQSQEDKIRKEIAIMKKCDHPHVVKLIEVLDAENSRKIYMVLEYLEKGEVKWQLTPEEILQKLHPSTESLSSRNPNLDLTTVEIPSNSVLENRKNDDISGNVKLKDITPEPLLSLDEVKRIFRDVLSGLDYLHHQGIIHRDIKPSNLLVSKDNQVKISDFGVSFAANLDDKDQADLELAKTAGTPAFLAPELCSSETRNMKVTYKIDIWALGVTLYCLLFGTLPFYAESEYRLFEKINHSEVQFPDTTRWRVAKPLSEYDFKVAKDLVLKLLDKNPETRIEIDEIVLHPFMRDNGQRWNDEYASWSKEMKIDVSNEEVDAAVVGLGNRIKKHLGGVFRRRKTNDGVENDDNVTISVKAVPMGLKDDCSYILSEQDSKSATQLPITLLNEKLDEKIDTITKSLKESGKLSIHAVDDSVTNSACVSPIIDTDSHSISADCTYGTSDETDKHLGLGSSSPKSNLQSPSSDQSDNYDYRNDLEGNADDVQLSVNPSFASLDSFYDDSYAKFMAPASNLYSGYNGSYSSRNPAFLMRAPVRSTSNSVKGSPVLSSIPMPGENASELLSLQEVRESLKLAQRTSNSPTSGDSILSGGALKAGKAVARGASLRMKTSPIQSALSIPSATQRSPTNLRAPGRTGVPMAVNPMINTGMKKNNKKPVFSISQFQSSDEDDDEDEECDSLKDVPIEFGKKEHARNLWKPQSKMMPDLESNHVRKVTTDPLDAKPANRKAVFVSGNSDDEEDDNQGNEDDDEVANANYTYTKPVKNTKAEDSTPSPGEPFPPPTKSAIYGTKLNLMGSIYQSDSEDDNDDDGDDSDELFLSFGRKRESNQQSPSVMKKDDRKILPTINTGPSYVSVTNICDDTTPTIVDVPNSIFQSENSSMNLKTPESARSSRYVMSKGGNITDEIAVLNIRDDEDLYGQD